VQRDLRSAQPPVDLGDGAALGQALVGLPELGDDLLRTVALPACRTLYQRLLMALRAVKVSEKGRNRSAPLVKVSAIHARD
jgi:hypothetical protein